MRDAYDVVVIGGGPSGSCVAGRLAKAGANVALVEGKRFPRPHIGESLLAMSMPLLSDWGVLSDLEEAGFLRKEGSLFLWGASGRQLTLDMPRPGYAFQVDRARFDDILLQHSARAGVDVTHEHWVRGLIREQDGAVSGVVVAGPGDDRHVEARFVIDASGLTQYVPRRLGLPIDVSGPRRVADSAYFRDAKRPPAPHTNDIVTEACEDGWLWFIPLTAEITSVGFVGDAADLVLDPDEALAREIESSTVVRDLVAPAGIERRARVLQYTNHMVGAPLWGDGYVIVGDSAMFVDPLFSTGVHGALYSATLAASAIASVLAGNAPERPAAEWYDRKVKAHYRRVQRMVRLLYGIHPGASRFWRSRDLSQIADAEGETWARELGVLGLRFFVGPATDGVLDLPAPLARRLDEFRFDVRPAAVDLDLDIALSPGVSTQPGWMRSGDRIVPALSLVHEAGRTAEIDYPASGFRARLIRALSDSASAAAAIAAADGSAAERAEAPLFLGTLMQAGVLVRRPDSLLSTVRSRSEVRT